MPASLLTASPDEFTPNGRLSDAPQRALKTVTIVVPTYREVQNLPILIDRIAEVRRTSGLDIDVLIMDDDSRDGSAELVAARPEPWVRMIVRTEDRGLSQAVLDGFRRAHGEVLVCMDADLSHPPSALPAMIAKLVEGADLVVGSRYVDGGSTSDDWGFIRWLNSRVATALARPLTTLSDPMSGFFALRRSTFDAGHHFSPVGYKIGLELLVKCHCERVVETAIHFEDRQFGESKLTLRQQVDYLKHLRRLYIFKYGLWTQLTQFLIVGALGTVVNLAVLTALLGVGTPTRLAVAGGVAVSMLSNFVLNRRFSFAGAHTQPWLKQLVRFVTAASFGTVINIITTFALLARIPTMRPQMAALAGVGVGMTFNFLASRYLVFRLHHVRGKRA